MAFEFSCIIIIWVNVAKSPYDLNSSITPLYTTTSFHSSNHPLSNILTFSHPIQTRKKKEKKTCLLKTPTSYPLQPNAVAKSWTLTSTNSSRNFRSGRKSSSDASRRKMQRQCSASGSQSKSLASPPSGRRSS